MKQIKPHISEKTVTKAKGGQFTLRVSADATKASVKYDIKKYFDLDVVSVNIINKKTVYKRGARNISKDRGIKKVIVKLKKNQKFPGFEIADESKDKESKK